LNIEYLWYRFALSFLLKSAASMAGSGLNSEPQNIEYRTAEFRRIESLRSALLTISTQPMNKPWPMLEPSPKIKKEKTNERSSMETNYIQFVFYAGYLFTVADISGDGPGHPGGSIRADS
jgi:hypothetical protein